MPHNIDVMRHRPIHESTMDDILKAFNIEDKNQISDLKESQRRLVSIIQTHTDTIYEAEYQIKQLKNTIVALVQRYVINNEY